MKRVQEIIAYEIEVNQFAADPAETAGSVIQKLGEQGYEIVQRVPDAKPWWQIQPTSTFGPALAAAA